MLQIDKATWHYRVFAHWKRLFSFRVPEDTDLCSYFWCVMAGISLFPLFHALLALFYGVVWILRAATFWSAGEIPRIGKSWNEWKTYEPFHIGRVHFYPSHVIVPLVTVPALILAFRKAFLEETKATLFAQICLMLFLFFPFFFANFATFVRGFRIDRVEGQPVKFNLLAEFLRAKKQGVCPLVEFKE